MFKVLALDGGGLRAAFQARLIERLEDLRGKSLQPDFYAGTSGGAIVACAIQKMSPAQAVEFFKEEGPKIFKRESFLDDIEDLWNLTGAKYYNTQLHKSLATLFGDMTLDSLPAKTLITSFALKSEEQYWQPVVFHNFPGVKGSPGLSVVDAILRSTAAPTYFPVYQDHCDGGVWGNNPSTSGLAAAADEMVGGQALKNIAILSLGTGRRPTQLKGNKRDLGAYDWYQKGLIDLLLNGNVDASHYYTRSLLGARYQRVQVDLEVDIKLDDAKAVSKMIAYADSVDLKPILDWMEGFWV